MNPPIEFNAIQRYKARVIKPILGRAEETERLLGELKATPPATLPPEPSPVALQKAATAIQDRPRVSMCRDRLEKIWQWTDRTLDKAESEIDDLLTAEQKRKFDAIEAKRREFTGGK